MAMTTESAMISVKLLASGGVVVVTAGRKDKEEEEEEDEDEPIPLANKVATPTRRLTTAKTTT
jgi:hypothetical protein